MRKPLPTPDSRANFTAARSTPSGSSRSVRVLADRRHSDLQEVGLKIPPGRTGDACPPPMLARHSPCWNTGSGGVRGKDGEFAALPRFPGSLPPPFQQAHEQRPQAAHTVCGRCGGMWLMSASSSCGRSWRRSNRLTSAGSSVGYVTAPLLTTGGPVPARPPLRGINDPR